MPVANPASLPTTRSLYTVLKSPFVHKKAQENFEKRVYKKIINVYDTSPQVVDMWLRYLNNNSVQGVGMSVKLKEFVELGAGRKEVEAVQSRFGMREEIEKQAEGLKKDLGEDGDVDQAGESKA
jgi:small subunit ribosomal protein S10